jgi:hypothetical protein
VIDVSNPANPQRVGGYYDEISGYANAVAVSGNYSYVTETIYYPCDYFDGCYPPSGSLNVIDISNPANPQRLGSYVTSRGVNAVAVSGNYAYVTETVYCCDYDGCYPRSGSLDIIDISNPANPQRVGGYDTSAYASGVAVAGNYVYVADGYAGLQVIDVSNPVNSQRVGGSDTTGSAWGVTVAGNYAYVADGSAGLQVIDVSDPANPRRVGGNNLFYAQGVTVANGKVFVAAGDQGLVILDLFQPPNSCPSAQDQNVLTQEDTPLQITLGAERDADAEPALYAISQFPIRGALTLAGNTAVYAPAPNYFGADSFKFTVTDGQADCPLREYAVNISVACVNDPPVASVSFALYECSLRFPGLAQPFIISLDGADAPVALNAAAADLVPDCDELGETLAYSWIYEDGTVLGNSPLLAGRFGLGCHTVTLTVSDGTDQAAVSASFCVITPGEVVEQCIVLLDSADIGRQDKRPLIATLKAATASFDRGNCSAATGQLRAFQNKVQAQLARDHPEAARFFLAYIEDLLNAITCITAAGSNPE